MPSINLAPGTQYIVAARKRRRNLFVLSTGIVLVMVLVWTGLFVYRQQLQRTQDELATRLRSIEIEIAKLEEEAERILLFENRLVSLDALLDRHTSWNDVFTEVERLMPGDTSLVSFEVDAATGIVGIQGTTGNIDQVAVAFASLVNAEGHQSIFTKGTIANVRRVELAQPEAPPIISYQFSGALTFDPGVLNDGNQ